MTWSRLLSLCAATRRPLVLVDFETSGLGGAPPVEYAIAYWAPWQAPEQDAASVLARGQCPLGLTYASHGRLNPGRKIDPGAFAVHGISDADVARCVRYDDLAGVAGAFRSLAEGDAATGEGPAVWVGHNLAESDVPWAQRWGYLPPHDAYDIGSGLPTRDSRRRASIDVVDTCRLARRLAASHPMPLAPDAVDWRHCPAVGHGLEPYRHTLGGLHTALFGDPPAAQHGALADCCSTARCLRAALDLWSPLWPTAVEAGDPAEALAGLLEAVNAPPLGHLSWDGWVAEDLARTRAWARGKHKGKPLTADPSYARWVASLPSSPTGVDGEAWCSDATREALSNKQ